MNNTYILYDCVNIRKLNLLGPINTSIGSVNAIGSNLSLLQLNVIESINYIKEFKDTRNISYVEEKVVIINDNTNGRKLSKEYRVYHYYNCIVKSYNIDDSILNVVIEFTNMTKENGKIPFDLLNRSYKLKQILR